MVDVCDMHSFESLLVNFSMHIHSLTFARTRANVRSCVITPAATSRFRSAPISKHICSSTRQRKLAALPLLPVALQAYSCWTMIGIKMVMKQLRRETHK